MIEQKDYKAIIKDIGSKLNISVLSNINDIKKNGLYSVLKFIRRNPIIRDVNNNFMVTEWDLIITGKGANVSILIDILNLEFRLAKFLQREDEINISNGIVVTDKKLRYIIIDNEDEPEENEVENENISYKKTYKMQIMFKK